RLALSVDAGPIEAVAAGQTTLSGRAAVAQGAAAVNVCLSAVLRLVIAGRRGSTRVVNAGPAHAVVRVLARLTVFTLVAEPAAIDVALRAVLGPVVAFRGPGIGGADRVDARPLEAIVVVGTALTGDTLLAVGAAAVHVRFVAIRRVVPTS